MTKRTAQAILSAQRTIYKAMEILKRERERLENQCASNLSDDIAWTESHLSQACEEGLGHHFDDAVEAWKRRSA